MKKIIGIVGGNHVGSTNFKLMNFIKKYFNAEVEIEIVDIKQIPLFNKPSNYLIPEPAKEISEKIFSADGVIIATPEHNYAAPSDLINFINWITYGVKPLLNKPIMIVGSMIGDGSGKAIGHLKTILGGSDVNAFVIPGTCYTISKSSKAFDEENNLKDENEIKMLSLLFHEFLDFVDGINLYEKNRSNSKNFWWDNGGKK